MQGLRVPLLVSAHASVLFWSWYPVVSVSFKNKKTTKALWGVRIRRRDCPLEA